MYTFLDSVKYKEPVLRGILGKLSFLPQVMSFLAFSERLGLILLAQTSAVSACAVVGLLTYIAVGGSMFVETVSWLKSFSFFLKKKYSAVSVTRGSSIRWRLSGPAEVYFLNQLSWDLVQAVGTSM